MNRSLFLIKPLLCGLMTFLLLPIVAEDGPWSLELKVGPEIAVDGKVVKKSDGELGGVPTRLSSQDWNDIYGPIVRVGLTTGYEITRFNAVAVTLSSGFASGDSTSIGKVNLADLNAEFDDYTDVGLDLVSRNQLKVLGKWVVGLSGSIGVRFVQGINANLTTADGSVNMPDVGFYDDSVVFAVGSDVHFRYVTSDTWSLGVETGLHWQDGLDEIEGLEGTGLSGANDRSRRVSIPLMFTVHADF
jgi:hypothetical protein